MEEEGEEEEEENSGRTVPLKCIVEEEDLHVISATTPTPTIWIDSPIDTAPSPRPVESSAAQQP